MNKLILYIIMFIVLVVCLAAFLSFQKEEIRKEKNCTESASATRHPFRCPVDKPYVRVSTVRDFSSYMCCEKE